MKTENSLISGVCGALLAVATSATLPAWCADDFLYWMIDQSGSGTPIAFQFARMMGEDVKVYETSDGNSGVLSDSYAQTGAEGTYMSEAVMNIGSSDTYSSLSFYIELCRYDKEKLVVLGTSDTYDFSAVRSSISSSSMQPANTLKVSAFTIPEPTSGLLMLLGLAGLALKRKHVDSKPQMKGAKA